MKEVEKHKKFIDLLLLKIQEHQLKVSEHNSKKEEEEKDEHEEEG